MLKKLISLLFVILLGGCAPPAPEFVKQDFVPIKDVVAASIYDQGLAYLKGARFIDAEMKFRAALSFFPKAENIWSNLALSLKGIGLYDESISIYTDLIKRNEKFVDYKFALADAYFRSEHFKESFKLYNEAMLAYEAQNLAANAAAAARTLSTSYLQVGQEEKALCFSQQALVYLPTNDESVRHAKLLLALGFYKDAAVIVDAIIQATPDIRDINTLKVEALSKAANGDMEQSKRYVDAAVEYTGAGDIDPEILALSLILETPEDADKEKESDDSEAKRELPVLLSPVLIYWPPELVVKYQAKLDAQEAEQE